MVALAIVASLSFAGAQPAAAANLSVLDQLSHLWSTVVGLHAAPAHARSLRSEKIPGSKGTTTTTPAPTDRGWGIDPNGFSGNPLGNG
jgi:hypothetical protein